MGAESEHEHGIDWRLRMTGELFFQINQELGPPTSEDQEWARYQIAREAANEFWDWIAAWGPERPFEPVFESRSDLCQRIMVLSSSRPVETRRD
jgi:hypothetical protein